MTIDELINKLTKLKNGSENSPEILCINFQSQLTDKYLSPKTTVRGVYLSPGLFVLVGGGLNDE